MPLLWQFTLNGQPTATRVNAGPEITIIPPSGSPSTFTPEYPGNSSFQLPTASNNYTWQFNWQTKKPDGTALPKGTYKVWIGSRQTGQVYNANPTLNNSKGPYYVTLE